MCFNLEEAFSSLDDKPLKVEDQFKYFGSNISFTESDVNIRIDKVCNAIDIRKSDHADKIKRGIFPRRNCVSTPA